LARLVARVQVARAEAIDRGRIDLPRRRVGQARPKPLEAAGEIARKPVTQRRIEAALLSTEEIERLQLRNEALEQQLRRLGETLLWREPYHRFHEMMVKEGRPQLEPLRHA